MDRGKDQSYFLWGLLQGQLARSVFPNGGLTKAKVRGMAQERRFIQPELKESREVCFIPQGDYGSFLRSRTADHCDAEGAIVDKSGRTLGRHRGIFGYTIGQRRGIGVPASNPYYILKIDLANNQVIVGAKEDLVARGLVAQGMRWLSIPLPKKEFRTLGQIRYRHQAAPCWVRPCAGDEVRVTFDEAQEAITPGQTLVLYQDDCVLGGGWIEEVRDE
jgi:tRNA-specific 2-thiouridylase